MFFWGDDGWLVGFFGLLYAVTKRELDAFDSILCFAVASAVKKGGVGEIPNDYSLGHAPTSSFFEKKIVFG